ncbi:MAG: nucleotidyltransferase domain-containing protein [Nanoarchaeota archaeon]|nr:nucleotidyltransferase domain-containing protein [Nanoarchaeota archaeon]
MNKEEILKEHIENIKISEAELKKIKEKTDEIISKINLELKKKKIAGDVFVGGSFAKGTIIKKELFDIDIFVRFSENKKYRDNEISGILEKVLKKLKPKKIHGSRDYFRAQEKNIGFEIIPVLKISNPEKAKNVTDLSFFHVSYVKKELEKNKKLAEQIMLAKSFCFAQGVYGAESYINGFSGYGLELLIIHYKSFLKFIESVPKHKDLIVIDIGKHYKTKKDVLENLNESKLDSPIIFIDPTYKERNVLAALSWETFEKFKKICREFLKNPKIKFFEKHDLNIGEIQKKAKIKKAELLVLKTKTKKQEGDIAGTKLLKFFNFFKIDLEKNFDVLEKGFEYRERKEAVFYFLIKIKKKIIINGPPINSFENVVKFKQKHKNVLIKNHKTYAVEKPLMTDEFLKTFRKKYRIVMRDMEICGFGRA